MENKELISSQGFYKKMRKTMDDNLSKLNEVMDYVLKKRAEYAKLKLELNQLYSPQLLHELLAMEENDGKGNDIKRYLDFIQNLGDISDFAQSDQNL